MGEEPSMEIPKLFILVIHVLKNSAARTMHDIPTIDEPGNTTDAGVFHCRKPQSKIVTREGDNLNSSIRMCNSEFQASPFSRRRASKPVCRINWADHGLRSTSSATPLVGIEFPLLSQWVSAPAK